MRVVLLGQQPEIVANRKQPFKKRPCLLEAAGERVVIRQPESAKQERAFTRRQPIDFRRLLGAIAQDESIDEQLSLDRGDGAAHTLVVRGEKAYQRHHEKARVEFAAVVFLHERSLRAVESADVDFLPDRIAMHAPPLDRPGMTELFTALIARSNATQA